MLVLLAARQVFMFKDFSKQFCAGEKVIFKMTWAWWGFYINFESMRKCSIYIHIQNEGRSVIHPEGTSNESDICKAMTIL